MGKGQRKRKDKERKRNMGWRGRKDGLKTSERVQDKEKERERMKREKQGIEGEKEHQMKLTRLLGLGWAGLG